MCDKYLFYVYTCLRWGKLRLTDDELSHLFGGRSHVVAQLDQQWLSRFAARCRLLYGGELKRCLTLSPLRTCDKAYRVRTGEGTFTTVDVRGRVVRIENFMDPPVPRRLAVGGGAFVHFEKTLSVFSDLAFRVRGHEARAAPSLVVCRRSGSRDTLGGLCTNWRTCYTVKERDIRGLTVDSDCIYTADGLSLYSLVASWKTDVCLIFDEGCREEIVRTLCALAMGGRELGEEFKLKCVLPDTSKGLDLRDLDPIESGSPLRDICAPRGIALEPLADDHRSDLGRSEQEGVAALRDMTRLPSGFSILAENENVVVLRHILRDALVIVPKTRACMTTAALGTDRSRNIGTPGPSGCITEWFPCGVSLFRVERGLPGVPPTVISCNLEGDEEDHEHRKTDSAWGEVPTLHVVRHSEYHGVLPTGFRSTGHVLDQSVCLLPTAMAIVGPQVLRFAGCVAVMYAFDVFGQLCGGGSQRSSAPLLLSFTSTLSLREAQALLLSYMCLTESFVSSENSCFRCTVKSHSVLTELRKIVSAAPRVHSGLAGLVLSGGERVMRQGLEDELLRIRQVLAREGSKEDTNKDPVPHGAAAGYGHQGVSRVLPNRDHCRHVGGSQEDHFLLPLHDQA
ncbi:hypothetical protein DPEC_G00068920 [Dallia pectoralis]|uniref:Uncharacterized protein n=1 Tax=Dallia pectoralis TaxID=75939 RepID=A0ACC2H2I9_DALPE|nr:hypothetical protein DPEC_G00068920 [Dallia pectoralis]